MPQNVLLPLHIFRTQPRGKTQLQAPLSWAPHLTLPCKDSHPTDEQTEAWLEPDGNQSRRVRQVSQLRSP